jgi:DNA primase
VALCPSHNDENPSLTASCNSEKILVKCQAGCTFKEIVSVLEMKQSQFFTPKEKTPPKKIVATYRYDDKDGGHVMDVVRFKPKGFRPRRPDGKWTLDGVTRVPYLLPQMLAGKKEGKDIILLEGEKDCDNAEKFGLVATTFAGGTGKWLEEYSKWFQEAKVICLPDHDDAGRKGMHHIASEISKVAESVRWLELPDLPEKGDFSDWIKIGGNDINKFNSFVEQSSSTWTSDLVKEDDNGQLLEEINQKYAVVPIGNKFTIVNETENETMFLAPSDFKLALQNRFATDTTGKFTK